METGHLLKHENLEMTSAYPRLLARETVRAAQWRLCKGGDSRVRDM